MWGANLPRSKPVRTALLLHSMARCCITWVRTRCAMWLAFWVPEVLAAHHCCGCGDDTQHGRALRTAASDAAG